MDDPLEFFWPVVDAVEPVLAADWVQAGAIERLVGAGLIRQTANAEYVTCPECNDGHMEAVIVRNGPHGRNRFFIQCPRHLRVEVFSEQLHWEAVATNWKQVSALCRNSWVHLLVLLLH